jgi:LmbE family N-acetylglucosaminyl deacetylase
VNAKNVLFISPHLDDVALSCSKSITALRRQGFEISVATLFSTSKEPNLAGKRAWEKVSYKERKNEDTNACRELGAQAIHLDFLDAPYRGREFNSFNKLFSQVPEKFPEFVRELSDRLESLCQEVRPLKIFAPLGIGWHIDHLLTFAAVMQLKQKNNFANTEFYFYEDRPYVFVAGALTIRLSQLQHFPASENPKFHLTKIGLALRHAYAWSFSPMTVKSQSNILKVFFGFLRTHSSAQSLGGQRSHE